MALIRNKRDLGISIIALLSSSAMWSGLRYHQWIQFYIGLGFLVGLIIEIILHYKVSSKL